MALYEEVLPELTCADAHLARVTIHRDNPPDSDTVILRYEWEGGAGLPFWVSRHLIDSEVVIFPASWGVVAIGQDDNYRYYVRTKWHTWKPQVAKADK